ncbi:MAG TPA: hydroxysqualene dehydroxylase HpnE, partial [Planctomycetota bacterium]|nr:hydroxysqualene dehydroxylase HpnE [Planctomycetota bacterium]
MTQALVVGAGLAGLAAALDLARAGVRVTLAERRAFPGGRAYSFTDASGETVDNGQHVFLECCTAYRTFLDEVGASDLVTLQDRAEVPFVDLRSGKTTVLCESWLPAPFHFLFSILGFKPLSWRDRRGILRAGRAMRKDAGSDAESLGAWLRARGQSDDAIRLFWDPSIVSVLNEHVDRVSSSQGIFVLRTAFFERKAAARVGVANVPLGEIASRAVDKIRALGGTVEFNRRIERLPEGPVIAAVPAKALLELAGSHPFFSPAAAMETSPIVNLHYFFESPVEAPRFFACVGGKLQWVFTKGRQVTISQSAARDIIDRPSAELEREFLVELRKALPGLKAPTRCVIVRERDATFVASPGGASRRLPCATPLPNLFLAGEWTAGQWPST